MICVWLYLGAGDYNWLVNGLKWSEGIGQSDKEQEDV